MIKSGQIVLFKFPQTDQLDAKLRPALLIGRLPGQFADWLICMISSQLRHCVEGFDEIVHQDAADFSTSGLKATSVIRVGRLAVVGESILVGSIGEITPERLNQDTKCNICSARMGKNSELKYFWIALTSAGIMDL